jgi:hypothetical protein
MQAKIKLNDQGIKIYFLQDYFLSVANVKITPNDVSPKQNILTNQKPLVGELNASSSTYASYDTDVSNENFTALTAMQTGASSTQTFTVALPIFLD